jgi:hypothetical protein
MASEEGMSLQAKALELVRSRGPICDSEGFYQHYGECYSDASQMVILFSDGIKEVIQPGLLLLDVGALKMEPIFEDMPSRRRNPYIERIPEYKQFLKHLQNRLARHIMNEYERLDTCPINSPFNVFQEISSRRRVSGTNAFGTIGGIQGITIEEYRESPGAFTEDNLRIIILILNKLFFPDAPIKVLEGLTDTSNAVILRATSSISLDGHALAWYECGGEQMMYEDNNGPFLFPWKTLFKLTAYPVMYVTGKLKIEKGGVVTFKTGWYPILFHQRKYYIFIHGKEEPIEVIPEEGNPVSMEFEFGDTKVTFTAPPFEKIGVFTVNKFQSLLPTSALGVAPTSSPFRYGARKIRVEANLGGGGRRRRTQRKKRRSLKNSKKLKRRS